MAKSPSDRCPTCRRKYKRGSEANRLYWALLHRMSERLHPHGQTFSADTLHLWAKSRWLGCVDSTLPNGKTLSIPKSTADLDATEFAAYFDQLQAWANEQGVFLEDMEA